MNKRHYAPEGGKTSINCSVTGEEFTGWFDTSNGQQISSDPSKRLHVRTNGSVSYLEINKVIKTDRGTYECRGQTNKAQVMLLVECKYRGREGMGIASVLFLDRRGPGREWPPTAVVFRYIACHSFMPQKTVSWEGKGGEELKWSLLI